MNPKNFKKQFLLTTLILEVVMLAFLSFVGVVLIGYLNFNFYTVMKSIFFSVMFGTVIVIYFAVMISSKHLFPVKEREAEKIFLKSGKSDKNVR